MLFLEATMYFPLFPYLQTTDLDSIIYGNHTQHKIQPYQIGFFNKLTNQWLNCVDHQGDVGVNGD